MVQLGEFLTVRPTREMFSHPFRNTALGLQAIFISLQLCHQFSWLALPFKVPSP